MDARADAQIGRSSTGRKRGAPLRSAPVIAGGRDDRVAGIRRGSEDFRSALPTRIPVPQTVGFARTPLRLRLPRKSVSSTAARYRPNGFVQNENSLRPASASAGSENPTAAGKGDRR